ncbi:uncharacterized protein LOC105830635 [Monomorium pharaonis]|uniref:uncharacterized protein LOC105830635 n=1 Tax=Monomorium pharaonis TaxID=307658 RepID=UPI00063FA0BB|nr:uncharacterized protein LOC105830635 [Monomorium pharaonis]
MATVFKSFIVIIVCFHLRFSHGFKLPYDEVKIVTYGEPCHPSRYLPVTIEEPIKPVTERISPTSCVYQPLKLNYRVITNKSIQPYQPQAEYPISIQVPQVSQSLAEIITPDLLRGKSYTYNIQTLPSPPVPISTRYDFDFQVPFSPISEAELTPQSVKPVKLLTGLTSRIDRVLLPACQVPSSSCCKSAL